jgi:hypothetical protein
MIGLIDDLSHKVIDGTYKLSESRPAPSSTCACSA